MTTLSYTSAGLATMAGVSGTVVSVTTQASSANRLGLRSADGACLHRKQQRLGAKAGACASQTTKRVWYSEALWSHVAW